MFDLAIHAGHRPLLAETNTWLTEKKLMISLRTVDIYRRYDFSQSVVSAFTNAHSKLVVTVNYGLTLPVT